MSFSSKVIKFIVSGSLKKTEIKNVVSFLIKFNTEYILTETNGRKQTDRIVIWKIRLGFCLLLLTMKEDTLTGKSRKQCHSSACN